MAPLSITIPSVRHFRSHSRNGSTSNLHSRSSSVDSRVSLDQIETHGVQTVQRWNGVTREATDWNALRRDPELYFPAGNCLIYLYTQGTSQRGPSFRMPYDFLLYSSCRPLIEQALLTSLQSPKYHPGSITPPSYENLHDPSATDHTYFSVYLDAPAGLDRERTFNYHINTRNFFAWLVGAPLVGKDPVTALIDLKGRMDIWRDAGADNFGALQQYVQEQAYGDFEEMETRMGNQLDGGSPEQDPRPYRNLGDIEVQPVPSLEMEDREEKRGRRASISRSIRSTSSKLRRKFSRSRTRKEDSDTSSSISGMPPLPATPTTPRFAASPMSMGPAPPPSVSQHKKTATARVPNDQGTPQRSKPTQPEPEPKQKVTKRASFVKRIKRRMSWAAGPLQPSDDPVRMPVQPAAGFYELQGAPVRKGPPEPDPELAPYALRVRTQSMRSLASLVEQQPQSAPAISNLPTGMVANFSRPNLGQSIHGSAAGSRASLAHGTYLDEKGDVRCECCGKLAKRRSTVTLGGGAGPSSSSFALHHPYAGSSTSVNSSTRGSVAPAPGPFRLPPASSHSAVTLPGPSPVASNSRRGSASRAQTYDSVDVRTAIPPATIHSTPETTGEAQRMLNERKEGKKKHRTFSREIFIPNYGNGLGLGSRNNSSKTTSTTTSTSSNAKGKQRETPASQLSTSTSTTPTPLYGPTTNTQTPLYHPTTTNTGVSIPALPELDFTHPHNLPQSRNQSKSQSRSASATRSPETASFVSAPQHLTSSSRVGSRAPSVGAEYRDSSFASPGGAGPAGYNMGGAGGYGYGYGYASAIASGNGIGTATSSVNGYATPISVSGGVGGGMSIHDLVTSPTTASSRASVRSGSRAREVDEESRRSVDGLIRELRIAGIAGPELDEESYGGDSGVVGGKGLEDEDEDEVVGVGVGVERVGHMGVRA